MEIRETKRRDWKRFAPVILYLLFSAASISVNLLCHEIFRERSSPALSFGFLYPLLGGGAVHLLLAALAAKLEESEYYPIFLGLYNAGIFSLTANQIATDFLEITGKDSSYTCLAAIVGWMLVAAGIIVLILVIWDIHEFGKRREDRQNKGGSL